MTWEHLGEAGVVLNRGAGGLAADHCSADPAAAGRFQCSFQVEKFYIVFEYFITIVGPLEHMQQVEGKLENCQSEWKFG